MFLSPELYSVEMEHDKSLLKNSPVYATHRNQIDAYIAIDKVMTDLVAKAGAKVTKLVKDDKSEQMVQIQCTDAQAQSFLTDTRLGTFNLLRSSVAWELLMCHHQDFTSVSKEKTKTFTSFEEAYAAATGNQSAKPPVV
jgi:hypothetical protein